MAKATPIEDGLEQYSYEFPFRIHTAKVYPLSASDGSTVIVYGHENGIRVVWRRPYRFEEMEDEKEPTIASALHSEDFYLGGAEALHIAFPPLPTELHQNTKAIPKLLTEEMVIAAVCSDYRIGVISLPITPIAGRNPAEHVVWLAGEPSHQSVPTCLSMTFTSRQTSGDADVATNDADEEFVQISSRPNSRDNRQATAPGEENWDLLIASVSPDLSGRLIVHRIPCNKSSFAGSTKIATPWMIHCLKSPAITLCFSPALYPSSHHSELLIAESSGVVRIVDCLAKVAEERWSTPLFMDFGFPDEVASPMLRSILDCEWILDGKAIIVLLSTGEWGIWDTKSAGSRLIEDALQHGISPIGSRCVFNGRVQARAAKSGSTFTDSKVSTSRLAPMTPSTRSLRQATLFASEPQQLQAPLRGGISVISSSTKSGRRGDDNAILLWHGTIILTIPSIITYWQNHVRGSGNLFGKGSKGEFKTISNVRFNNQVCNGMSLDPCSTGFEIVITAGSCLILIASQITEEHRPAVVPKVEAVTISTDDHSLSARELDIFGMNRVLDTMSKSRSLRDLATNRNARAVNT